MDTNKAAYWIALGVLALGLNNEYRQGILLRCIVSQDAPIPPVCQVLDLCGANSGGRCEGLTDRRECYRRRYS